ncbi:MAG: HAD family hydrolase [Clostridia bacterium]|nr:HAD family hydrolase [Clostridia bacterium]
MNRYKVGEMSPLYGRMLVCDMDGTLLNSSRQVSEENKAAINSFVEMGGLFTVATGRSQESVRRFLEHLPVNTPVIASNGALVYDYSTEKVLWNSYLDDSARYIVEEILELFPGIAVEVFHDKYTYFIAENEETKRHLEREHFCPIRLPLEEVPYPWTKAIFVWDNKNLQSVKRYLDSRGGNFRFVFSEPEFVELLDVNATKGHALRELVRHIGVNISEVVAMGDNLNDIELIECAGVGIAVSNAHDELKCIAKHCCCHHDEHAVREVIDWMKKGII